jgi:hypothetical protein
MSSSTSTCSATQDTLEHEDVDASVNEGPANVNETCAASETPCGSTIDSGDVESLKPIEENIDSPKVNLTWDHEYYYHDGNCVIRVEDTLFRVSANACILPNLKYIY